MMKPAHVIEFCDYKLKQYQAKQDIAYAKYLAYETKINNRWYNKLFNLKYQPSLWASIHIANKKNRHTRYIEMINDLKKVAIYKDKMGYDTMIIKNNTYNQQFYNWADENNIPY